MKGLFRVRKGKKRPIMTGCSASWETAGILNESYSFDGKIRVKGLNFLWLSETFLVRFHVKLGFS